MRRLWILLFTVLVEYKCIAMPNTNVNVNVNNIVQGEPSQDKIPPPCTWGASCGMGGTCTGTGTCPKGQEPIPGYCGFWSQNCVCCRPSAPCPYKSCKGFYQNKLYEGYCRPDGCKFGETSIEYCPNSNCKCCFNVLQDPKECLKGTLPPCEALDGKCINKDASCDGREVIHETFCRNSETCKCCFPKKPCDCPEKTLAPCAALNGTCISQDKTCEGRTVTHNAFCNSTNDCKCCFPEDDCPCHPEECKYKDREGKDREGVCSRDDVPGFFPVGAQQCRDGCTCFVGPPPPPCQIEECEYKEREGVCSREDVPGFFPVGAQQCRDGCTCFVGPPPPPCDLRECKYKNVTGRCSREDIPGAVSVGEQQCRDGCKCFIEISPPRCVPRNCTYKERNGSCSREVIPGSVPVGQQQCSDGCECYIEKPPPACVPRDCSIKNRTGVCSREDIPGTVPVGEQQCRDGCLCYIKIPPPPCVPWDCEYKNKKGRCSREDIPGSVPVGEQQCRDGCECYIEKPPPPCNPPECNFKGRSGVCSPVNIVGSISVGTQQCKDECKCYIKISPPPCNTLLCEYEGRKGRCSRRDIPGAVSVGEQQCTEGCNCYIERPTECISKPKKCTEPDYCEDKNVSCRKGYAKIYDTCFKNKLKPWPVSVNCDCCKKTECRSIGNRCTGAGSHCIDRAAVCPKLYTESLDCWRPRIVNGVWVQSQLCKCCKPIIIIGQDCDNNRKCHRPSADEAGYHPTGHCRQTCQSDEKPFDTCDINNQDDCQCCLRQKEDCDNNRKCHRPRADEAGYHPTGHCRQTCQSDEKPWDTCDINNQDDCQCCLRQKEDCDNNRKCDRPSADEAGYHRTGHCRQTCQSDEKPWDTCDTNNQDDCQCCLRQKEVIDCGPGCPAAVPSLCMCMINNNPCPNGYCFYDSDLCDDDHCTCCKEGPRNYCFSVNNQCSAPKDYCVEKISGDCPKGFGKINNACSKKFIDDHQLEKSVISNLPRPYDNDCDCCKKLGCTSNGDRCTGPGSYCIEPKASCPRNYDTTEDCSKPVIVNGVYTESELCKCCKPLKIVISDELAHQLSSKNIF